jgi:hypothetical protein
MLKKISDADFLYVDDSYGIYTELYERLRMLGITKALLGLQNLGLLTY